MIDALARFLDQYVLGYDRAALLADLLPATEAQLAVLQAATHHDNDLALLDALPYATGIFAEAPARMQQAILAALQVGVRCRSRGSPGRRVGGLEGWREGG